MNAKEWKKEKKEKEIVKCSHVLHLTTNLTQQPVFSVSVKVPALDKNRKEFTGVVQYFIIYIIK